MERLVQTCIESKRNYDSANAELTALAQRISLSGGLQVPQNQVKQVRDRKDKSARSLKCAIDAPFVAVLLIHVKVKFFGYSDNRLWLVLIFATLLWAFAIAVYTFYLTFSLSALGAAGASVPARNVGLATCPGTVMSRPGLNDRISRAVVRSNCPFELCPR
ncbi:MAG: hypothetical protein JOZ62_03310 [Acidobacteriaceae bacterium]|nr:hypothetical protein [Acidobacteriaceae bacterium]